MGEYFTVEVNKVYEHLTIDELCEKLKTLTNDYAVGWKITPDYDCDCDGFRSFNGHYNVEVNAGLGGLETLEDIVEGSKYSYEQIVENAK